MPPAATTRGAGNSRILDIYSAGGRRNTNTMNKRDIKNLINIAIIELAIILIIFKGCI